MVLANVTMLIATDNTTVVADFNRQGSLLSRSLFELNGRCFFFCCMLRARHISGKKNILAVHLACFSAVVVGMDLKTGGG